MNNVKGFILAAAAAALFTAGCTTQADTGASSGDNSSHNAKSMNSCKGKAGCKGSGSCKSQ